jgi:hypothetical protein
MFSFLRYAQARLNAIVGSTKGASSKDNKISRLPISALLSFDHTWKSTVRLPTLCDVCGACDSYMIRTRKAISTHSLEHLFRPVKMEHVALLPEYISIIIHRGPGLLILLCGVRRWLKIREGIDFVVWVIRSFRKMQLAEWRAQLSRSMWRTPSLPYQREK